MTVMVIEEQASITVLARLRREIDADREAMAHHFEEMGERYSKRTLFIQGPNRSLRLLPVKG